MGASAELGQDWSNANNWRATGADIHCLQWTLSCNCLCRAGYDWAWYYLDRSKSLLIGITLGPGIAGNGPTLGLSWDETGQWRASIGGRFGGLNGAVSFNKDGYQGVDASYTTDQWGDESGIGGDGSSTSSFNFSKSGDFIGSSTLAAIDVTYNTEEMARENIINAMASGQLDESEGNTLLANLRPGSLEGAATWVGDTLAGDNYNTQVEQEFLASQDARPLPQDPAGNLPGGDRYPAREANVETAGTRVREEDEVGQFIDEEPGMDYDSLSDEEKREVQDLIWEAKEDHTGMAGPGALTDKESKQVNENAKQKLYEKSGITIIDSDGNKVDIQNKSNDTDSNADKDWVKVETGSKIGEYEVNGDKRTLSVGFVKGDVERNENFVRMGANSHLEINESSEKDKKNISTIRVKNKEKDKNLNVDLDILIENRKNFEQSDLSRTNESQLERAFRKLTDKSHPYAQNIARQEKVKDWHKENAKDIFVSDKDMLDALNAGPISPNMPTQGLQNSQDQSISPYIIDQLKKYPGVIVIPMNDDDEIYYYYNEPIQKKQDIKKLLD